MKFDKWIQRSVWVLVPLVLVGAGTFAAKQLGGKKLPPQVATSQIALKESIIGVSGMYCAGCAVSVKSTLKKLGVESRVDYVSGKVVVKYDPRKVTMDKMRAAITKLGYTCPISQTNQ